MKKLLFYINLIDFGGAERVLVNLANKFSNSGYEVVLVTSYIEKKEFRLDEKIKRLSLEDKSEQRSFIRKNIIRTYRLRKICIKEKPDIVISFMAEPNFRALAAVRFLGIKTLISVRNDPDKEYPDKLYKLMAKFLYPMASGCVFQTIDAQKWFPEKVQRKSEIILNYADEKFYQVCYEGERKNIAAVGRLESQKNYELLIKSFAEIAEEFPDENLIIYGDGSQRRALEELSKYLNIENRVCFMGIVSDIQENIKAVKLFVLSSDYEGMPNALMEAMALGLPVISTDCPCGGPKMLIDNNKNGILVKTGDIGNMADAMRRILSDSDFAGILSQNARLTAGDFEPEKIFQKWKCCIDRIIENH